MPKKHITFTEAQYARQLALLFLASPEHSPEEVALTHALDSVCVRLGFETDQFVESITRTVSVEMLEEPQVNAAGGAA
jgi:hypothetical protein